MRIGVRVDGLDNRRIAAAASRLAARRFVETRLPANEAGGDAGAGASATARSQHPATVPSANADNNGGE